MKKALDTRLLKSVLAGLSLVLMANTSVAAKQDATPVKQDDAPVSN